MKSEQLPSEEKVVTGCEWTLDDALGFWDTTCGQTHAFIDGNPIDNGYKFCPYCGLALDQLPYSEPEDDDEEMDDATRYALGAM